MNNVSIGAGVIRAVDFIPDDLCRECNDIADHVLGDAENLHYSMLYDVNAMQGRMFIHVVNGLLTGFIRGRAIRGNDIAHIDILVVERRFQRAGIGTRLMNAYQQYARENGAKKIVLETQLAKNAMHFYNRMGFMRMGMANRMEKSL